MVSGHIQHIHLTVVQYIVESYNIYYVEMFYITPNICTAKKVQNFLRWLILFRQLNPNSLHSTINTTKKNDTQTAYISSLGVSKLEVSNNGSGGQTWCNTKSSSAFQGDINVLDDFSEFYAHDGLDDEEDSLSTWMIMISIIIFLKADLDVLGDINHSEGGGETIPTSMILINL